MGRRAGRPKPSRDGRRGPPPRAHAGAGVRREAGALLDWRACKAEESAPTPVTALATRCGLAFHEGGAGGDREKA